MENASHDHGHHQIALPARISIEDALQAQPAQGSQAGGDVAMGQRAEDGEGFADRHQCLALDHPAQVVDLLGGPIGEIGQGHLTDLAALANGLAQEHGGRGVAVGHNVDIHGH